MAMLDHEINSSRIKPMDTTIHTQKQLRETGTHSLVNCRTSSRSIAV